jgi:hypothetical protein
LVAGGIPQVGSTAEIGSISFDQIGVELMLTDQQAELITKRSVALLMSIVDGWGSWPLRIRGTSGHRFPTKLFDRTNADPVGLPKSAIYGSGFGHTHLGASDERRDVRGIGVAITDETVRCGILVDNGFENPSACCGFR